MLLEPDPVGHSPPSALDCENALRELINRGVQRSPCVPSAFDYHGENIGEAQAIVMIGAFLLNGFIMANTVMFWHHSSFAIAMAPEIQESDILPEILPNATCHDWAAWIPSASHPAVVMQVISKGYVPVQENFIRFMERNSRFTRHHLYLLCMDDESVNFFSTSMGFRCVPIKALAIRDHEDLWVLRVHVLSCLVAADMNVIMSDADALWLDDPEPYFSLHNALASSIVASRGSFPPRLGKQWGATLCMGFIFFRSTGQQKNMSDFLSVVNEFVIKSRDDQQSINFAAEYLGIVWNQESSDMRYAPSTALGLGSIAALTNDEGEPFRVTLLPHNAFTRLCDKTPISNSTAVAHCFSHKKASSKTQWMKKKNLWVVEDDGKLR